MLDAQEMLFGEIVDYPGRLMDPLVAHPSVFQYGDYVVMENPKRFSRFVLVDSRAGTQNTNITFADMDFIQNGTIEVKPKGVFFLDWLDYTSQFLYCRAYLRFLEGRIKAKAMQSGLVLPSVNLK
jgi:hypothetical protein